MLKIKKNVIALGFGCLFLLGAIYVMPATAAPGVEEWQFNDTATPELKKFKNFVRHEILLHSEGSATGGAAATATATATAETASDLSDADIQTLFPALIGKEGQIRAFIKKFASVYKDNGYGSEILKDNGYYGLEACCLPLKNLAFVALRLVNDIVQKYPDRKMPIVHTTFLGGDFLPAYIFVDALINIGGYKNIIINDIHGYPAQPIKIGYFNDLIRAEYKGVEVKLNVYNSVDEYIKAIRSGEPKSISFDLIDAGGILNPSSGEVSVNYLDSSCFKLFNSTTFPVTNIAIIHTDKLKGKDKQQQKVKLIDKLRTLSEKGSTIEGINAELLEFAKEEDSPLKGIERFNQRSFTPFEFANLIEQTKADANPIIYEVNGGEFDEVQHGHEHEIYGTIRKHIGFYQVRYILELLYGKEDRTIFCSDAGGAAAT